MTSSTKKRPGSCYWHDDELVINPETIAKSGSWRRRSMIEQVGVGFCEVHVVLVSCYQFGQNDYRSFVV